MSDLLPSLPSRPESDAPQLAEGPNPLWLRLVGLAVACVGGLVVAILGAFLTPFRIGSILIPISLLLVVAGLTAVTRFARAVTDHVGLSLVPGIVWLVVSLVFSTRTTEGDLVLVEQIWVGTVYLLVGSVTLGVLGFRMIVPGRR